MAKPILTPVLETHEVSVTLMRKIGPERFEVVEGTITGPVVVKKVLEKSVSLAVGRETSRRSLRKQHETASAKLGLPAKS